MKRLVIIGASGHGKVIADIALLNGYDQVDFLDDNPDVKAVGEYKVLGTSSMALGLAEKGYDFVVGIGNAVIRERIQMELEAVGCNIVTLIHPKAVVAYDAKIVEGTVVMAGAVINAGTVIGAGCIVNTCASIDHDCTIGDFSHVSVGAHTAGAVNIGKKCWIGIGAVVSNNISICDECIIGAGAVVVKDIEKAGTYVGVPAERIK